uniref:Uncharacterized protein n=1 Tax=Bracon brevicornis TaxID=1563983 RepID=A0A6V7I518_9HYME
MSCGEGHRITKMGKMEMRNYKEKEKKIVKIEINMEEKMADKWPELDENSKSRKKNMSLIQFHLQTTLRLFRFHLNANLSEVLSGSGLFMVQ